MTPYATPADRARALYRLPTAPRRNRTLEICQAHPPLLAGGRWPGEGHVSCVVDAAPTAALPVAAGSTLASLRSGAQLPFGRQSFDLVTSFRFFGNAQHELRAAVLPALNRALKPGGYLIINSHRNPRSIAALLHGLTGGEPSGMDLHWGKLKGLLRRHGFEIAQVLPIAAWMVRFKLQAQAHDPRRAARLERRYGHPIFASMAPDVLVVARKLG